MPEYIRALVVILFLGIVGFIACKPAITGSAMPVEDFDRRRKYWFLITLAGFLSQDFFLFAIILIVILSVAYQNEKKPLVLFFFLFLALPQIKVEIPGFSGIRYLVEIDYLRILTVVLLLPVYLKQRRQAGEKLRAFKYVDYLLISYVVLTIILHSLYETPTAVIRNAVYFAVDIFLPYFAISRGIEKLEDFKEIFAAMLVAGSIVAAVAMVEFAKSWLLYLPMQDALSVPYEAAYLGRGDFIRTLATSGQPIVLGYVLMAIIGVSVYLRASIAPKWMFWMGLAALLVAEITTLSKGPWLGVCALFLVLLVSGRKLAKNASRAALVLFPAVVYLMNTEAGGKIMQYLPFVGTIDDLNVTYRQRLMTKGLEIVDANPWFGSSDYLLQMEDLRQGQGIIDIVNSYLGVALDSGLVGLSLYAGFFLSILVLIYKARLVHQQNPEFRLLGNVLMAVLASILIVLVSVSSIFHVTIIYVSFAAFGIAYARLTSKIAVKQL